MSLALLNGVIIGFAVAVPIGPISVLCTQRALRDGLWVAVASGAGAATAHGSSFARAGLTERSWPSAGGTSWNNSARQCRCNYRIRLGRYQEAEAVVAQYPTVRPIIHLDAFARAYQSNDHAALSGGLDRCRRRLTIFGRVFAWCGGRHVGSAFVVRSTQRSHYRMSPSAGGHCGRPCQPRGRGVADRIRRQHRARRLVGIRADRAIAAARIRQT